MTQIQIILAQIDAEMSHPRVRMDRYCALAWIRQRILSQMRKSGDVSTTA